VRRAALISLALLAALLAAAPGAGAQRERFDTRLMARIPPPGFPAMAYVHPSGRVYVGTYVNPGGDSVPSRVLEYDQDGTLLRSWTVPGQDLSKDHGVQVATSDAQGSLVLLDRTPSRALLLDTRTGAFREYATFANLSPCPPAQVRTDCSPTLEDRDPMANYAAWGPDGSLYVSDFLQGVVWRVPPGGGEARGWLSDRRLDGGEFGTTGLALAEDRRTLLIGQGSSAGLGALNPTTGKIYAVEIRPDGSPGELRQLWESSPTDLPDGFVIARSGRLYVPLAGTANQIAVLAPDGSELERFPGSPGDGDNGSPVPFDTPSSARFLGTRLIVANQSFSGNRDHQALLDVEVGETGLPELIPGLDLEAPALTRVSLSRKRVRTGRRGRTRVRFRVSEPSTLSFRIERRVGRAWRDAWSFTRRCDAGPGSARFNARELRPGRYRVGVRAQDAARNRSRRVTRRFRVLSGRRP
jgi:sugar lactone lactonase YvrE